MTISFRLNETEADMIKAYAKMQGMTVSELIRRIVIGSQNCHGAH